MRVGLDWENKHLETRLPLTVCSIVLKILLFTDPDLLGGFGKRSPSSLKARLLHQTRGV